MNSRIFIYLTNILKWERNIRNCIAYLKVHIRNVIKLYSISRPLKLFSSSIKGEKGYTPIIMHISLLENTYHILVKATLWKKFSLLSLNLLWRSEKPEGNIIKIWVYFMTSKFKSSKTTQTDLKPLFLLLNTRLGALRAAK